MLCIFVRVYTLYYFTGDGQCRPVRFYLRFLGSVQVKYPKGSQVLTQAIQKVIYLALLCSLTVGSIH